jgi:hypothetical protein
MKKSVAALVAVMVAVPLVSVAARHAASPSQTAADGTTLYVGGSDPGNYSSIQAAVDACSDGDRVFIYEGIYREQVTVTSSVALTGASTDVIVDAQRHGTAFRLRAPDVRLHSLTARSSGGGPDDALVSTRFAGLSVSDCVFADARQGLLADNASRIQVDNCTFSHVAKGISLLSCHDATVANCTFYKNGIGIWAHATGHLRIRDLFSEQCGTAVMLRAAHDVSVRRSTLSSNNENQANLYAEFSSDISVTECHIHDSGFGVHFEECVDVSMDGCHVHDNKIAVRFSESTSCSLTGSDVYANDVAVYLIASGDITVTHANFHSNYVSTLAADNSSCDARYNWWGSQLGPVDEVHGSIFRVHTYPWLREPKNHTMHGAAERSLDSVHTGNTASGMATPAVGKDTDGDGVPDWWEERYGYDPDGWNNHSQLDPDDDGLSNVEEYLTDGWGSHPFRQDLFIEIDVMNASYGLTEKKKQRMIEAFARHNITLHIDDGWMGGSDVITHEEYVNYATLVDFYWTYFLNGEPGYWRKGVFHYVILSDMLFKTMPGFVFIGWDEADSFTLSMRYYREEIPAVFRDHVHATVFMHELGHTLGLFHDLYHGIDNESSLIPFPLPFIQGQVTYARYLSCMSYQYAWQILDYSDGSHGRGDFDDWGHIDLTFFQDSHWG